MTAPVAPPSADPPPCISAESPRHLAPSPCLPAGPPRVTAGPLRPPLPRLVLLTLLLLPGAVALPGVGPGAAAGQPLGAGARAAGLGGAATALAGDAGGQANPAAWATCPQRTLTLFASEGFGLPALRLGAFTLVYPTRRATLTAAARSFGTGDYRETTFTAGLARRFHLGTTRAFYAGLALRLHQVAISSYGSAGAPGISAGWLVPVLPSLHAAFYAENLNRPRLAGRERLPRSIAVGLAYRPAPAVYLLADAYKDIRFPLAVRAGLEVWPVPALALRTGAATQPVRFSAGAGLRLSRLEVDLAAERHAVLGWTPAVSVGASW